MLDEYLSWKNHISVVENKVSENIGVLHKAKNIFSKGGLKSLYFLSKPGKAPLEQNWKGSQVNKERLLEFMLENIQGENARTESFKYLQT